MRKNLSLVMACMILLGLLAGCQAEDSLRLSAKKEREIIQAYLLHHGLAQMLTTDDLSARVVWKSDDLYALYVDSGVAYTGENRVVTFQKLNEDGSADGSKMIAFNFPNDQCLYIYQNGSFYTLKEAYDTGIITYAHLVSLQKDEVYLNYVLPDELKLSEKLTQTIKQTYFNLEGPETEYSADEWVVHPVWRSGDTYALYIHPLNVTPLDGGDTINISKHSSDGSYAGFYVFEFVFLKTFYIYRDNCIYSLKEAYDAGVLTETQVGSLWEVYKNSPGYYGR